MQAATERAEPLIAQGDMSVTVRVRVPRVLDPRNPRLTPQLEVETFPDMDVLAACTLLHRGIHEMLKMMHQARAAALEEENALGLGAVAPEH